MPGVTAASVGGGIGVARPSTAQVAEKAGTAQAAGSGADIHALLDTNPLAANASWRASANHLEAGVALDDRTWVAVEATRQGGAVNVGVHAVAGGEAQSLAGLIAGVSAHLQERRVEVGELSLSLRQEHAGAGADMAGGGGAGYSQRQAQQNLLPSGRETGPARDAAPNRAGAGGAELRDGELGRAFRRISLQA